MNIFWNFSHFPYWKFSYDKFDVLAYFKSINYIQKIFFDLEEGIKIKNIIFQNSEGTESVITVNGICSDLLIFLNLYYNFRG